MIDQQELIRDLTESYLKSLIAEASDSLDTSFDPSAPFGELGLNSFHVLKIIKKLEADFGRLPKSLLFENFNVNDLTNYFVGQHEQTLATKFASELERAHSYVPAADRQRTPVAVVEPARTAVESRVPTPIQRKAEPIRILEKDAYEHADLRDLVKTLSDRYKSEGCVSRGTRKIAPNLFIGSARRGYFNYSRSKNILLAYGYAGPLDYLPELLEEMQEYSLARGFQLNILSGGDLPPIGGTTYSSTPFGVMQRILKLKEFTLEGGPMRRLRYQVSKFQKAGACRTEEYRSGSDSATDESITRVMDRWCESRTVVNPLVYDVRAEILAGTLGPEHRLFLTYLGDALQNVILITAMSSAENGYLMDLEFYLPDMPLGGLEFAIAEIVKVLVSEGCDLLSLGGTYGCRLGPSQNADPDVDRILDDLRDQNIFNEEGNLQFKNKFRTENTPILLCRPVGSGNADNVIDIIMMIADPVRMQTSEAENHNAPAAGLEEAAAPSAPSIAQPVAATAGEWQAPIIAGNARSAVLSEHGFNPLSLPYELVEIDLKTDSWAQLKMPAIDAQMKHLHARLQQPVDLDESIRVVFPFSHCVLTASGQAAENLFFKAWPRKGVILQNLLFPSTIFHEIDKGFDTKELPCRSLFDVNAPDPFKGNMDLQALQAQVAKDPGAIACVCIEVGNNAAGGAPVSLQHLRDVKALLAPLAIPLVIDATRVVENAQLLIEREPELAGRNLWTVVREIFSQADAVIGSLTKDFCVNKGGIIASNDPALFQRLQELVQEEGAGIDLIERKMIALALQDRRQIEAKVARRMDGVRRIWEALNESGVPVVGPAGGHCILIDVKQLPEFAALRDPVASFVAWIYLQTGMRAGAHSVGMQQNTSLNELVRLAIPVGLKSADIDTVIQRLTGAFANKVNIPEVVRKGHAPSPLDGVYASYELVQYHNLVPPDVAQAEAIPEPPRETKRAAVSVPTVSVAPPVAVRLEETIVTEPAPVFPTAPPVMTPTRVEVRQVAPVESRVSEPEVSGQPPRRQEIAIIGMAGRYPKARDMREMWSNLAQGRDCVEEIPTERYERRLLHERVEKYRGGFIDNVDCFDSLFFNISPREAEILDPQERLFMEVAWEAIEDAGYYPEILTREDGSRNVGVFVGAVWAMYQMLGVEEKHLGNKVSPNSFLWSVANRVSYWMNLSGPSMTVDTACSSSLTAIHLACEAIHAGDCSSAIVGGVNLDVHQAKLDINSSSGALSPDGVCRSFGKGANGYVAGEGVGALYLKPLDQAIQDGDRIYGVIKSAAVNHGGRTGGYTVPSPAAQAGLITTALERARVDPRSIGFIEAHGTGTELGDPIEITGLSNAFKAYAVGNQTCAIGSVKSNIGHLEAAAGLVGVAKVLLQMKHRQLVPSLHTAELNEFIDFESSPFYVVRALEEWKAKEVDGALAPLRAGVSSFGAGGANAHVILESYEPAFRNEEGDGRPVELAFPLSAKNEEQLRDMAARLARFLQSSTDELRDVAHTLQVGRKSFDHRLAIIAATREELLERLSAFAEGRKAEHVVAGHVTGAEALTRLLNRREKEEFVRLLLQRRDPQKLAELWVEGLLSDWTGFQTNDSGRKISLPTYPFADKRHWIGRKTAAVVVARPAAGMHPLVDTNESTFERQLFKKTFHDQDFFIYDHLVADIQTLPGVAYLELARKAGELAAGRPVRKIRNILWVSPISVQSSARKEVFIELKPSGDTVGFEVFSEGPDGHKQLHSQGKLLYTTKEEASAGPEYVDLDTVRARCAKTIDGKTAYPLFKSFGLNLGPSFQVLQDVYKSDKEILGVLKLPEFRQGDLETMVLLPSLVDGSLQTGVAAQLGERMDEMLVPFSIGEVEILHPLTSNCFSYVTESNDERKEKKDQRVVRSNVLIIDETGKVLVKLKDCTGVPLRDVHKSEAKPDADGFSRLYYAYEWEKAPLAADPAVSGPPSLLLFDTGETLRDLYRERVAPGGTQPSEIILVQPGDGFEEVDALSYRIQPDNADDYGRLFDALIARNVAIENICLAWPNGLAGGADGATGPALERGVHSFLFVIQALVRLKLDSKAQLLYLHSGPPDQAAPHHEAVAGFINTLRLEHPKLLTKVVDVRREGDDSAPVVDAMLAELQARVQDAAAVRYEAGVRSARKLKAFDLDEPAGSSAPGIGLKEKGAYLITGGAGGLGLIFAEFLAKEYKARLILTGRSVLSAEREARLDALNALGAEVHYVAADVSSEDEVRGLIAETKARFGEIHGIIHSAGVLRDSYVRNKTADDLRAVFAPKVHGTRFLDEATKDETLDFFVTFSSLAAVTGNAGQCDYSFANHFMDSFAQQREQRRAQGSRSGKTLSVNWSLWADGGMRPDEQTELYFRKTLGMRPLSAETGLDAFARGLKSQRPQFAVLEGIKEKLEQAWGLNKKAPAPAPAAAPQAPASSSAAAPSGGPDASLQVWLENELSQMVIDFLKLDPADMSVEKILLDLGFDSIGLTTYANAINEKFELDITPILFFEYPSVAEIAKHLSVERESEIRRFHGSGGKAAPAAAASSGAQAVAAAPSAHAEPVLGIRKGWDPTALDGEARPRSSGRDLSPELRFINDPIAIVGMSGVMPESEDMDAFWENLKNSKDMITVIPEDRWNWEEYYGDPLKEANKSNSKWGGFMKEVDKFDPLFFGISPREALMMDPQQRIFLETVWKAIEDSGQKVSSLSGTKTGLFVGVATNDYADMMTSTPTVLDAYTASGNSHSVLANRVSFLLNLRGPSAPIDTACSSSLVALHRAIESIHTGSSDMAIVGGVQVMLSPAAYISFGMAGMLSDDGKCKTFDKRANGYVRGEGSGAVFLKRLSAAEADGNHVYAVIRSTAENHGGKVTTLTAPNPAAQTELIIEAYQKAQVDPGTVGYIECHGTGTSLGDPIEIQALSKAFAELYKRNDRQPAETPHCGLSSVKTNIGHLETAAGIASILKVLLAIKNKQIPANLHFEELNPFINLKGTPFYIADKLTPWVAQTSVGGATLPRRAGVSSFGFGGANAHIVLEEYISPARRTAVAPPDHLIVLSAKNEERLLAYVESMRAYVAETQFDLTDFAYTLQAGRDEMQERLALAATDKDDLLHKFAEILGGRTPEGAFRNNIRNKAGRTLLPEGASGEALLQTLIERRDLSQLAELWASGAKIDWALLYKQDTPRRISVPTYPFARERHWIPATEGSRRDEKPGQPAALSVAQLHPLVHRNVSTLKEQKFASRFTGKEFFLADHRVKTDAVLPAVAYVEMIAAAGELSGEQKVRVIRNMVWLTPLTVADEGRDVEVALLPGASEIEFAVRTTLNGEAMTHCRGKLAYTDGSSEQSIFDVDQIRRRCTEETIAGTDLYPFLGTSELNLGPGFQVAQQVFAGRAESLAVLQVPEHHKTLVQDFWLHPGLLDGAVHTAIGLMKKHNPQIPWSVPYSVTEVQIFGSLRDVAYAHAVWDAEAAQDEKRPIKVQLHLLDRDGKVLVRMKDFIAKPFRPTAAQLSIKEEAAAVQDTKNEGGLQSFMPVWNPVRQGEGNASPEAAKVLLLGGDERRLDWVRTSYPNAQRLSLNAAATIDDIERALAAVTFDELLWIAPDVEPVTQTDSGEGIVAQQEEGTLAVFRIIKALLRRGHGTGKLQWTLITGGTQPVTELERVLPAHAGIAGLAGSLAKEYPHWDLRLLDVESLAAVSLRECLSLPWDKQGNGLAHRDGEWFRQGLALMEAQPEAAPVYRKNGVYVVVGGAGGLGEVWTRFMLENYQANVIWIGRRPLDQAMEQKIQSLAGVGPAPLYVSADATNLQELEKARRTILTAHPVIHGVVHSAIVLNDHSLARMDETGFRASLSAKVDISVNLDRVFGDSELDFALFFSSIISFSRSPGQSNYSAGCTFKDSFAQAMQQRRAYPVKVMNWGFWGNVGVVADESYNKLMAQMGVGSIEPHEGMASLQMLVGSSVRQVAVIKTLNSQATAGLNLTEAVHFHPASSASLSLPPDEAARVSSRPVAGLEDDSPTQEMTDLVTDLFAASLMSIGLFRDGAHTIAALSLERRPASYYERWLAGSIRYLQQQNVLSADLTLLRDVRTLDALWNEWEARRSTWATNPNLQAQITLLEACLRGLPGVVSGAQRATDVMFPNSSMHLVEGVYRGNALADYFNEVLADTLLASIEQGLRADRERGFRVLEIGAGTGGTTAKLLPLLTSYPVEEYCYTDVSKAFLMYAEKNFKPEFPSLTTALFDVTKPLSSQTIAAGHYDFVIAANVLHATPDIRETIRNAKAALKNQGILLLNEIATWSLFNHLTFGLLEGWWLQEDVAVRLPGSPGLAPEKWRRILTEEGFDSLLFPTEGAHRLGQQIIAAASNGWTRQRIVKQAPVQRSARVETAPAQPAAATAASRPASNVPASSGRTEAAVADHVRQVITEQLSEALRMNASMIRSDGPFADYGVDSIIGVNLIRSINEALQIELETMSLFEYSTVDQLSDFVQQNWQQQIAARLAPASIASEPALASPAAIVPAEPPSMTMANRFVTSASFAAVQGEVVLDEDGGPDGFNAGPIAIIGMSGRFAESETLDLFWENLAQGRHLVKEVSRWRASDCVMSGSAGQPYCSHGSFVESVDQFDPAFFGISPEEAVYMDPQQRVFLEESWRALEDAGYGGKAAHEKQCGVYVGVGTSNYADLFGDNPPAQAWWGNSQSVVPARIAYHLNLQGPAMAVDTACSSTLVAMHLACQGLWSGETEMALAGGVYVQATSGFHQVANRAGMLSPEGKCASFDGKATGFVPGEAVGVIVLKRLRDALRDGDHIHGVIAGTGINQDGASNGLIAPSARAQERLERSVYDRFDIHPETIDMVEAHATATIMGDSIEALAIGRAFREYTDRKQFCAIGSVKTNIGHAGSAAGIAAVLKVLLSLKNRQIPPSLHFVSQNPAIDFAASPFYVNTELKAWPAAASHKRRAAISSFGFSGTNAHLVLEEAPALERTRDDAPGYVVMLSARTADQLRQQVQNLLAFLRQTPGVSMNDLSYTLFTGRLHLTHRVACAARNQEELIRLLAQWIETGAASQVYSAEIQDGRVREQPTMKKLGNFCIQECRTGTDAANHLEYLATIADLYVQGYSLDYRTLFAPASRRMPLPTYPFARERYWIDSADAAQPVAGAHSLALLQPVSMLHPLLHVNTSNLSQQSYRTAFNGTEPLLRDHQYASEGRGKEKILPEVAYLEMVRAAVADAAPIVQGSSVLELRDIVWAHPIVVAGPKPVDVALVAMDDEQVAYEISSVENGQQTIHGQGRAVLCARPDVAPLHLELLRKQLTQGKLDPGSLYSTLARMGLDDGPALRALTEIELGDGQLLARLAVAPTGDERGAYGLDPHLMIGVVQAAMGLVIAPAAVPGRVPSLSALGTLRVLAPLTAEVFAHVRHSQSAPAGGAISLDADLTDAAGNVLVQLRGLSFRVEAAEPEPVAQPLWRFEAVQDSAMVGAAQIVALPADEKMELFLKQETALQLKKPVGEVPINRSYFDLGLSSLAITTLLQRTNRLLDENLSPSALFEYRDIQSLAAHLASSYPEKVDAIAALRHEGKASPAESRMEVQAPTLEPLPRRKSFSGRLGAASPDVQGVAEANGDELLEKVLWRAPSVDDSYEKVTF